MAENSYDVVVIGGGPGGYVTAIRASQLGMKSCVIEQGELGGICLNWGCIPTKALLRTSEIYRNCLQAEEFGISVSEISFDIEKVIKRSRTVARRLSAGVQHLLRKNKVDVIEGHGKLGGQGAVEIEKDGAIVNSVTFKHLILATGARGRTLPGIEPDGRLIWGYKEALLPDILPKSILIIGSGAIGIEFASFYGTLGSNVTVVEVLPQILPAEDKEISGLAQNAFEAQGISIMTESKVLSLEKRKGDIKGVIENENKKSEHIFERVILAVGITGNIEDLGIENLKIEIANGHIVTDKWGHTGEQDIYAIGDVSGPPWLAHKASHEGIICIEKIAGLDVKPLDKSRIPGCTYCHPQIASLGLTEELAIKKGHSIRVGKFPFTGNGKAIALGESEGLVKTIFDSETGELLGAHMIGAEVTELIQGYSIAKTLETTEAEIMETVFPHPTLSEMMHESALNAYGRTIHY